MKKNKNSWLIVLALFSSSELFGQWCLDLPATIEEIADCNRQIALTFAPRFDQYVSYCDDGNSSVGGGTAGDSEGGDADRIVRVDFDGDWIATNNWQSLENLDSPLQGYDIRPMAYYAVSWTDVNWIIVYTFYLARDWAKTQTGCSADEHEGDFVKVFVVVKRPTSQNQDPEDLLIGFQTTKQKEDCISLIEDANGGTDFNTYIPSPNDNLVAPGAHPRVYSAAGSHHLFTDALDGFNDPGYNPCNPNPISRRRYYPASSNSNITTSLIPITFEEGCYAGCEAQLPEVVVYCSSSEEHYGLIDIFDSTEGLWAQRDNNSMFTDDPYNHQRLLCDDGGGCPQKAPWAPWEGPWGVNPLQEVFENGFNNFNCDCNDNPNCQEFEITECIYEYNPYLCPFYDIAMPGQFQYNGVWEDNPHQDNQDLVVAFRFSAFDVPANADVTWCWELPAGFNNTVTCVGCTQTPVNNCVTQGSSIVLKIADASIEDLTVNPEDFKVTATADFIECGTVEKEFTLQVQLKNIINTDTANCEKMVFEVKEAWHIDGNVYDWDFPLYDALATVSSSGRRVEFNTASVIQQTSETTNPERKLEYNLTVTNPSYTSEIELNGEREIPDCSYGGLGLMVYPNPATNDIYLEFEGVQQDEPLDIQIFDHQFNRVGRESYFLKGQTIDVSGLGNGLYFLCAVTKEGKMLISKFCVGRY